MNEEYIRQLAKETLEEQISKEIKKHLDSGIIFKYISDIENELQSYKQKEDKLREYLTNTEFEERTAYDTSFCEGVYNTKEKALKILNEGE